MPKRDDLRHLVEDQLPKLGYDILNSGPRWMYNRRDFKDRVNWAHDEYNDYALAEREGGKIRYVKAEDWGDQGTAYVYQAIGNDGRLNSNWNMVFYNLRLIDIEDVDPQPVQVLNPEAVQLVSVDKTNNNSPSPLNYTINTSKEEVKAEDHEFGATLSTEFETEMSRTAKAGIGVAEGEASFKARFLAKAEARTDHAWRKSDTLSESVEKSYTIYPYHSLEVLIQRGNPHLRQSIPTYGRLECSVRIDIRNANAQDFASLDDLIQVWRGLKGGSEMYSAFFSGGRGVADEAINKWHRPKLTLDITVEGQRVRYANADYVSVPIPGREAEAAEYVEKYKDAIGS